MSAPFLRWIPPFISFSLSALAEDARKAQSMEIAGPMHQSRVSSEMCVVFAGREITLISAIEVDASHDELNRTAEDCRQLDDDGNGPKGFSGPLKKSVLQAL